ncbi:formyltransferase family protein [Achromobacter xylosoxidans]
MKPSAPFTQSPVRTLLLVSNDRLGRRLVSELGEQPGLLRCFDQSSSWRRVLKLLRRGSLSPSLVLKMQLAEWQRPNFPAPEIGAIHNNAELVSLIRKHGIQRVYLFRAGLIVGRAVLDTGAEILNTHCAALPYYGGLGSIARALAAGDLTQCATLHRVTESIDSGEVLATEPYVMDAGLSYAANEARAYDAGLRLLLRELTTDISGFPKGHQ